MLSIDAATHATALARYRASLPSGTSFVDQVSLAVIERDGIETILALDPEFARPNLAVIPADERELPAMPSDVGRR